MKQSMSAPYHPLVTPRLPVKTNSTMPSVVNGFRSVTPTQGVTLPSFSLPRISLPSFSLPSFSFTPPWGRAGTEGAMQTGTMANNPLKRILGGK